MIYDIKRASGVMIDLIGFHARIHFENAIEERVRLFSLYVLLII